LTFTGRTERPLRALRTLFTKPLALSAASTAATSPPPALAGTIALTLLARGRNEAFE
jgi:hypothetical protein